MRITSPGRLDDGGAERVERIVRERVAGDATVEAGPVWLTVVPAGSVVAEHGWKLHISSRAPTFPGLLEVVLPALLAEGCVFKLARSPEVLRKLNDGATSPATVGKALTVYPDQSRVRDLGLRLAELLSGRQGPRVLSDRRVSPSAPVYYRYGPFTGAWRSTPRGGLVTRIAGPDGTLFDGIATLNYRQPPWAADPFTGDGPAAGDGSPVGDGPGATVIGDHFRIVEGVSESARGNVFRAVDERGNSVVIIKQARALVDEQHGWDARSRLRNERRALQALAGTRGVPRFIDHFRHGDDEFLVTSDCGDSSLAQDVWRNGPYPLRDPGGQDPGEPRDLARLAENLARIVAGVHRRGVVARDISPKNVVIDGNGVSLVDFGHASCDGDHVIGGTPGYAPARQMSGEPPVPADDLHALGMTLLFAAQGIEPVSLGEDPDTPRLRALQTIRATWGAEPDGVIAGVADLISGDDDRAAAAFRRFAGDPAADLYPVGPARLPEVPVITADLAGTIAGNLLTDLTGQARALLTAPTQTSAGHDASLYSGSAGIGRELLHHLSRPGVPGLVEELAAFTVRACRETDLVPGLFTGSTGAAVFLQEAATRGIGPAEPGGSAIAGPPPPEWHPEGGDLIVGASGVGLGHLSLYRATGEAAHLDVARRCAEELMRGDGAMTAFETEDLPVSAALDKSAGRAHGLAGVVEFLLAYADVAGDEHVRAHAAGQADELAVRAEDLISRAWGVGAVPLSMSWCQGLAGIARTLLRAGDLLGKPDLALTAARAADVCAARRSRITSLGQCCGAAGVGSMLLEFAARGSERHLDAARDIATHMLLRSAGPADHPMFVEDAPADGTASWAFGLTGILAFFRQLSAGCSSASSAPGVGPPAA
ncbi:MAG: class IV lanthionine synthetase LanL [Nocardiopsaceae bacterium]|nr:class IV lanthionine synthetase LanL [Nocardiopsaceae bacterium]